jgi:hypothetical protein
LTLSDTAGIRSVEFSLHYRPELLQISNAIVDAALPAGSQATIDSEAPGVATITFSTPDELPVGPIQFANLVAAVPTENSALNYGQSQVLEIRDLTVLNDVGGTIPGDGDQGLHIATFFGDASGNGRINSADAAFVARHAAGLDTGFAAAILVDPVVFVDVSGNARVNANDAAKIAQFSALIPVPEIPPVPVGVLSARHGDRTSLPDRGQFGGWLVPQATLAAASHQQQFDLAVDLAVGPARELPRIHTYDRRETTYGYSQADGPLPNVAPAVLGDSGANADVALEYLLRNDELAPVVLEELLKTLP